LSTARLNIWVTIGHFIWISASIVLFIFADAHSFQRPGSLGIVIAILSTYGNTNEINRVRRDLLEPGKFDAKNELELSVAHSQIFKTEVFIGAVAKLQWGYGDLFHNIFH
jgi:hypothetical protein